MSISLKSATLASRESERDEAEVGTFVVDAEVSV
jgi:hypothetical protein